MQPEERLGRQDEAEIVGAGPPRVASARSASSVSTVYDGPTRSSSHPIDREALVAGDGQLDHGQAVAPRP